MLFGTLRLTSELDIKNDFSTGVINAGFNPEITDRYIATEDSLNIPRLIKTRSAMVVLDQIEGIEKQAEALSNMGILSLFIGMTTDSRSFLSFQRNDYFRRIICNILGDDMERGLIPDDLDLVSKMVEDISYHNVG